MEFFSLAQLISPTDSAAFLEAKWGKECELYAGSVVAGADRLLNLTSFETLLATLNRAHEGWLHFVQGGLKAVPVDMVDEQGMLKLQRIHAAFSQGETLYLTKAERVCLPLMQLTEAIQLDLLAAGVRVREPVNAHVFLTPARSQGFALHRDEHASFILQLDGCKEWTVYKPCSEDSLTNNEPPRPGGIAVSSINSKHKSTYQLHPGDVLYMPEWWPHEARALDVHSLHVTLRIFPLRWMDFLVSLFSQHPTLTDVFPRSICKSETCDLLSKSLEEMLDSPAFRMVLPRLCDGFQRRQSLRKTVLPNDGLRHIVSLEQIKLETVLVRSTGTTCELRETGEEVCLVFPGGTIRGPSAIKPVFAYLTSAMKFQVKDLPTLNGSDYDRVSLARAFVRDGLLQMSSASL
jgi:hypothetical protein